MEPQKPGNSPGSNVNQTRIQEQVVSDGIMELRHHLENTSLIMCIERDPLF